MWGDSGGVGPLVWGWATTPGDIALLEGDWKECGALFGTPGGGGGGAGMNARKPEAEDARGGGPVAPKEDSKSGVDPADEVGPQAPWWPPIALSDR